MTLISVILPFRDAVETLESAIVSILQQSHKNLELILINDNSQDGSLAVAKAKNDARIKVINNKGNGLVSALNTAINCAAGTYIARMDADDISLPHRLQEQFAHLQDLPENYVLSCLVNYKRRGNIEQNSSGYQIHVDWLNSLHTAKEHFEERFADAPIAHPTLFCRKDIFTNYGYYKDEAHPEDFELWLRWMAQGVRFEKVNLSLYDWFDQPNRLSRIDPNYNSEKFFEVKAKYFSTWWAGQKRKKIWIVGYGKEVFRRTRPLENCGLRLEGYVDLKPRQDSTRKVIGYDDIIKDEETFYLVYVGDRAGKKLIREFFNKKGMAPLSYYLFMI